MQGGYRGKIIRSVTFLAGLYFVFEFLVPSEIAKNIGLSRYEEPIANGFILVGAMAIGLGIINLLMGHGTRIVFKRSGWFNSLTLLLSMFLMMWVSGADWINSIQYTNKLKELSLLADFSTVIKSDFESGNSNVKPFYERNVLLKNAILEKLNEETLQLDSNEVNSSVFQSYINEIKEVLTKTKEDVSHLATTPNEIPNFEANLIVHQDLGDLSVKLSKYYMKSYSKSDIKKLFDFLNEGFFVALGSAMFSLLGVYIASAAYRAFRIKNLESGLMMLAAIIVMLGQVSLTSEWFGSVRQWLLEVPNSAAFRAIKIGASIAGLVIALRIWLSIESETFSRNTDEA